MQKELAAVARVLACNKVILYNIIYYEEFTFIIFKQRKLIMFFKSFQVTGKLRSGKRFKKLNFNSFHAANMINIYNGSVWGVKEDGTRKLLKRVYN